MPSRRLIAAISAVALMAAGPALAQSNAPVAGQERAAAALSPSNALRSDGDDQIGYVMAGLVLAGVALVLILIYGDDDDEDDDKSPVSP